MQNEPRTITAAQLRERPTIRRLDAELREGDHVVTVYPPRSADLFRDYVEILQDWSTHDVHPCMVLLAGANAEPLRELPDLRGHDLILVFTAFGSIGIRTPESLAEGEGTAQYTLRVVRGEGTGGRRMVRLILSNWKGACLHLFGGLLKAGHRDAQKAETVS